MKKTNLLQKNSDSGITLIALVITIIVLLILAAVSISMVVGNNGILAKANKAKKETAEATAKEELQMEINAIASDYYQSDYDTTPEGFIAHLYSHKTDLKNATKQYIDDADKKDTDSANMEEKTENNITTYTIKYKNYTFGISENGTLTSQARTAQWQNNN